MWAVGVVLVLLPGAVESWAPKKHTPVDLTSLRISKKRMSGAATTEHTQRRQLQSGVGNYDLDRYAATARATEHWDDTQLGLSGYNFDQLTHQGARKERFGYDPLPQIRVRDPTAPPTPAEMFPRMLNMNPEEQMLELAQDYARRKAVEKGAYNSDWCRRSAILPGESGCSAETSTRDGIVLSNSDTTQDDIQAVIYAATSVLSASGDEATP